MNRTRQWPYLGFAPVLLFATAAGGQATSSQSKDDKTAEPQMIVRLHFEVLELNLTPEQVDRISRSNAPVDSEALAAETIEAGNARVKHVFDAPLIVGKQINLNAETRVPIVQGSHVSKAGVRSSTVTYEDVGCNFECATRRAGAPHTGSIALSCQVEVSDWGRDPSVMLTEDLPAPIFLDAEQRFSTIVELGVDYSFSSLSSQPPTPEGKAGARTYLYRLRLDGPPKVPAAPQKKAVDAPQR
ncbi:MAG: hypothetical protein GY778_26575 [bacterium]|nr:hypothetical protein [bacterium]